MKKAHPRGVTLLELAVSLAVGSMVFLILGGIFLAESQLFDIHNAIAQTEINAFQAIDTTGLYMNSVRAILANATVNGASYSTTSTLVVMQMPSIDSTGAIIGNTYDLIAIGQDPADSTHFMFDLQKGAGSARPNGKYVKAILVDKVIFRYNTVDPTKATSIDLYIRTSMTKRGRTITTPLGKIYHLGASS